MTTIPVHSAFHKTGMDFMGSLRRTAAGNCYVITCVDMTKWVEAIVLPDKSSRKSAEFLFR